MNAIAIAVFVALVGISFAAPAGDERAFDKDAALAKANGIKKCIMDNKDKPDADKQIPPCILALFSSEVEAGKAKVQEYMAKAGEDVTQFFLKCSTEVQGYYQAAKSKALSGLAQVGEKLSSVKDKVFGWVDRTLG